MEEFTIDEGLNPAQLEAVTHADGPLLVVAGAGSGKTRVLTRRIAYLIRERNVSPFGILAITFTNKAAGEMKDRVVRLVGDIAQSMWISTFHSACVRMLRRDAGLIGYPSHFTIYDQGDSARLVGHVVRDLGLEVKRFSPRALQSVISGAKNEGLDAASYSSQATGPYEERVADIFCGYQKRLQDAGAMDFDDLLVNTVQLLYTQPQILEDHRSRFGHILVDEYQDTNSIQNDLVLMLAQEHRNICVVGDSDQSIYQFRGADVRNFLDFEKVFPETTVVILDQNYRSTQNILDAANSIITQNEERPTKRLWTDAGPGSPVLLYRANDEDDEAEWLVREILSLRRTGRYRWDEIAVFYRTNAQSRSIEERLIRLGVPYRVIGSTRFYERREVRDALAYLRLAVNPIDEVAIRRVLNVPKRGIGDNSVSRLENWTRETGSSFVDSLNHAEEAQVSGRALSGICSFLKLIEMLTTKVGDGPASVIESALTDSGYLDELRVEQTMEAEGRLENLAELLGVAAEFDSTDEYLEQVGLVADTDQLPSVGDLIDSADAPRSDGQVVLMTLHAAKGLEFPVVFLAGVEEGVLPHIRAVGDADQLSEERRLAYVGITRAREILHLSHAWSRMLHGATQFNPPSRFLSEIPSELITEMGSTRERRQSFQTSQIPFVRDPSGMYGGGLEGQVNSTLTDEYEPAGAILGSGQRISDATKRRSLRDPSRSGAHELGLSLGERVVHEAWGEGRVLGISGEGDRSEAVVSFSSVGEKRLLLVWAPLRRANEGD